MSFNKLGANLLKYFQPLGFSFPDSKIEMFHEVISESDYHHTEALGPQDGLTDATKCKGQVPRVARMRQNGV